jgi:hypothetical protein
MSTRTLINWLEAALLLVWVFAVSCGGGGNSNTPNPTSTPQPQQNITVSVSPPSATMAPNGRQQYTATVTGTTNTGVIWSANKVQGGNAAVGTINASGLYTAPATAPNPSAVNITAVSVADGTSSGKAVANVLVHHANQDFQSPPVKLGTSGGNANDKNTITDPTTGKREIFCCSGTLGSLVSRGGDLFILSNNHVLDKSGTGTPGDPISQPGLADTNCGQNPNIMVANLTQAAPLATACGNVDAAIAKVIAGEVDVTGTILDLNGVGQPAPPSATLATAAVNQLVAKSGDATGLTCSTVDAVDLLVTVKYTKTCNDTDNTFSVTFDQQIGIAGGTFSNSGDSGSLIVTSDTARPVALLYAGSSSDSVGNPIQNVLAALKDSGGGAPEIVGGGDHAVGCPAAAQSQAVAREQSLKLTRLPDGEIARAAAVKDRLGAELMRDAAVTGVGVGQSDDNPNESAIVVFLKERPRVPIPAQIDGVRTKVILGSEFRPEQTAATANLGVRRSVSEAEIARVKTAKEKHAQDMMADPAILGVGVGASSDNPEEAALVVFVEKGKSVSVPAEIDGARTRVIATDPFRTFNWGTRTMRACSRK